MYAYLPLSPRKARHFPPSSGEADTKEKRIHSFYILRKSQNNEMIHTKKLPRRLKEIKERMHVLSRPRSSGKVAAVAVGRGKYDQKWKNSFY